MRSICALTIAVVLVFLLGPVEAAIQTVGDPIEGDSWAQGFIESGVGPFDFMAVKMVSAGDYFEEPVFYSFTNGGWKDLLKGSSLTYGIAEGPAVTSLQFNIRFFGSRSNPLEFIFVAFGGDALKEEANAKWTGSGWNITSSSAWQNLYPVDPFTPQALKGEAGLIPEPASLLVWLMLGGLGFFAASRWRKPGR